MKQFRIFTFLFLISFFAKAQTADTAKLIGIHTAVGKTVTRDEKIKYQLFPEYKNDEFDSARVYRYNDSTYELRISISDGSTIKTTINSNQMDELYNRIDNISKGKTADGDYALTPEEKKRQHDERVRDERSEFWSDFLIDMMAATLEVIFTAIFIN